MAWQSSGASNAELVENMWRNGLITKPEVKAAFLKVDRGFYAPEAPYEDSPQDIGYGATISAPHMHAAAAEELLPFVLPQGGSTPARPRRVLDVGSGSGYLTQVLAELAGDGSIVIGVEHISALRDLGERNMAKSDHGRALLAAGRVRFRVGDGRKGWVEDGGEKGTHGWGWDAIHVGASATEVHQDLLDQLRSPGRMFIPVDASAGSSSQHVWVVEKDVHGEVTRKKMFGVRYVPLTNAPTKYL